MFDSVNATGELLDYASALTIEQVVTAAVTMIEKNVGDDEAGNNQPFFAACRKELETQGYTLGETDTGECEWSVRIFEPLTFETENDKYRKETIE